MVAALGCTFLKSEVHYWILSTVLALAGTGGFTFFRSLLSDLSPPDQAAKIFGVSSSVGRLSGFLGPLIFGLVADWTGNQRYGFIPIIGFLFFAAVALARVDIHRGKARASNVEELLVKKDLACSESSHTRPRDEDATLSIPTEGTGLLMNGRQG